jgi:hypothetical protein
MEEATCMLEQDVSLVQLYVEALSVTAKSKECYIYGYRFVCTVNFFETVVHAHNTNSYYHQEERHLEERNDYCSKISLTY